jgi:SAM-dependent methyltransferase
MAKPTCPVCDASTLTPLLTRRDVPVHQNLVFSSVSDARGMSRGDLEMYACDRCGFVFNASFDPTRLSYGPQYENTQNASPVFQSYVDGLVQKLLDTRRVRHSRIVEVGCGKGGFIRALVSADATHNTGVGFDPSYVGPDAELDGRLRFERRLYDASCTDVAVDVLVCRHVIEHVVDPLALLRAFATALAGQPGARVFLETPCVAWILKNTVVWDLFYEHCSLFTGASLATACARAGFCVQSVEHTFGGQYLWLEATNTDPGSDQLRPGQIPALARAFGSAFTTRVGEWNETVRQLARTRTLALWGAGAKGATFANLVDPDQQLFTCVVDVNPGKQGSYLGGTGHKIVSPRELAEYGVTTAVLLNPNYAQEVQAQLEAEHLAIDVLDMGAK